MDVKTLVEEISHLPYEDQLFIVEKTTETLKGEQSNRLKKAVDVLLHDYVNDKDLTAFTSLDIENFYEAK